MSEVTRSEFEGIKESLGRLRRKVDWMLGQDGRTRRGTTRANHEAAELQRQLASAGQRFNEADDPAVREAISEEIRRVNGRINDVTTDVNAQLSELRETTGRHTVEIGMLQEGQQSLSRRVGAIQEQGRPPFPLIRLGLALITGVVAALAWNRIGSAGSITLPDGQILPFHYEAWTSFIAGFIVFSFVFGFSLLFAARRTQGEVVEAELENQRSAQPTPNPVASPEVSGDNTPTAVLPTVNAGASAR